MHEEKDEEGDKENRESFRGLHKCASPVCEGLTSEISKGIRYYNIGEGYKDSVTGAIFCGESCCKHTRKEFTRENDSWLEREI